MHMKYLAVLLLIPAAGPQSPTARPVFEAASIKMTAPSGGGGNSYSRGTPGLLRASMTLKSYIMMAYNLRRFQVNGGPKWMDDSTYDIVAKLDRAFMPEDATRKLLSEATVLALQALLADRFQLKFHHETKEMPAFVLTAIKRRFHLSPVEKGDHCGTRSNGDVRGTKFTGTCLSMGLRGLRSESARSSRVGSDACRRSLYVLAGMVPRRSENGRVRRSQPGWAAVLFYGDRTDWVEARIAEGAGGHSGGG
jgi:uncharacterized protein (TIGR03435 family)